MQQAQRAGKLRAGFNPPGHWIDNTPVHLSARLRAFRHDGTLPDYPLGSDFTEVERRIVKALGWLKANTATPWKKIGTVLRALGAQPGDAEAMARMDLAAPGNLGEHIEAKLLALGLRETR